MEEEADALQPQELAAPATPVSPGPGYECAQCGKTFPNSTRYNKHVKLHSNLKSFRCAVPGCGKSFKRKPHLTRHLATHQERRPYQCSRPGCGKTFTSNQRLAKHLKSHDKLCCETCGETFRKRVKYEQHLWTHNSAISIIRCPECDEAVDKSALQRHMKRHKSHQCSECEETFLHFQDLVKHRRAVHSKKLSLCPECGKAFARPSALRDHQLRVHAEQLLLCPRADCGQTFTSASNLYQHERVAHLGLKPFSCPQCGETFAYRHVLKRHRMLIHTAIPLKNASSRSQGHDEEGREEEQADMPDLTSITKDLSRRRATSACSTFSQSACGCRGDSCPHLPAASETPKHTSPAAAFSEEGGVKQSPPKRLRRLVLSPRCGPVSGAPESERSRSICIK